MKKPGKVILGVATAMPLVYLGVFAVLFLSLFLSVATGHLPPGTKTSGGGPPPAFIAMFALQCVMMTWTVVLLVIYIRDVFQNPRVAPDKRALWAVVLFLGNTIAMPIYWYLYVWRDPRSDLSR